MSQERVSLKYYMHQNLNTKTQNGIGQKKSKDPEKNNIHMKSTKNQYIKDAVKFADWVQKQQGTMRMTLPQARALVQPWVDSMVSRGLKAETIKTYASAVCKALDGITLSDIKRPQCSYYDISRGRHMAQNDDYNQEHASDAIALNRIIGIRRAELARLDVQHIRFDSPDAPNQQGDEIITPHAKNGKTNHIYVTDPYNRQMLRNFVDTAKARAVKHGRDPEQELLLQKHDMANNADLHHERALRAQRVYWDCVHDFRANPGKREEAKAWLFQRFRDAKQPTVGKNRKCDMQLLDYDYVQRGECAGQHWDRVAVMVASIQLGHWRANTTVQHYLTA